MGERVNLSGNSISRVWREGDWIYKQQPKHLADNEYYALTHPSLASYVPSGAARIDKETIRMEFVENEPVTDCEAFMLHYWPVLHALKSANLRHDDITVYAVLVRSNKPILIDWAESRVFDDPRPGKRIEGDAYWLKKTMEKLCRERLTDEPPN